MGEPEVVIKCHGCGHEMSGYQWGELVVEHGWRFHNAGSVELVQHECTGPNCNRHGGFAPSRDLYIMCDNCEAERVKLELAAQLAEIENLPESSS